MSKNCVNQRMHPFVCYVYGCAYGCLISFLILVLLILILWFVSVQIAESMLFLKTENIKLAKKSDYSPVVNDPRTAVIVNGLRHNDRRIPQSSFQKSSFQNGELILKESDVFFVLVDSYESHGINISPSRKFKNESRFSFYRIQQDTKDGKPYVVKTEFLGSIHTNMYGAWNTNRVSITSDGKYITMNAHGVNSRSLGKYRNKALLLTWEIGDKVVEKDVVSRYGKKIPIVIKTDEELEKE